MSQITSVDNIAKDNQKLEEKVEQLVRISRFSTIHLGFKSPARQGG